MGILAYWNQFVERGYIRQERRSGRGRWRGERGRSEREGGRGRSGGHRRVEVRWFRSSVGV